jgi:hypothetical protein
MRHQLCMLETKIFQGVSTKKYQTQKKKKTTHISIDGLPSLIITFFMANEVRM